MRLGHVVVDASKVSGGSGGLYTVTATIPQFGNQSFSVIYDGTYIWASGTNGSQELMRIDPSTNAVLSDNAGLAIFPEGVGFDGTKIWLADLLGNRMHSFDPSTGASISFFTVSSNPERMAFDGLNMWVTNDGGSNHIDKFNTATGTVTATVPVLSINIGAVVFDGTYIWVASAIGGTTPGLTKIDPSSNTVVSTISPLVPPGPGGTSALYGMTFDGTYIWVCGNDNFVYKIDPVSVSIVGSFPSSQPRCIFFADSKIWVGENNTGFGRIIGVDPTTLSTFVTIPVDGGNQYVPHDISFQGSSLWIACDGNPHSAVLKLRII